MFFNKTAFFLYKHRKLKFVVISDTHCRHRSLHLPKGDVLIHAGDISLKGMEEEVVDFLSWFSALDFEHKIFVPGNHDFLFEKQSKQHIQKLIPAGVVYLNDSGVTINNINIWGSPITPWFFGWAFNRRRGEEIRKHWKMIPDQTDILISHGPPYGTLDIVVNEKHVGCRDLLQRVLEIKPKFVISGHVHESYGRIHRNGINFINASVLNESYELVNKPLVFDL